MPPRPKSKSKESAEQRRLRLEMEALSAAEEEAARQAAAASQLKQAASREAEMTAINSRRLNAEWLQRMRASKLEELQAEAAALARQHDAAMDRRERLAEALLEDLAAQNAQHEAAASAHSRVLDELLELHGGRLGALHSQFTQDLRQMQAEFESEKAEMAAQHHRAKKELGDIAAALQQSYADTRAQAAAAYRLQEEEVRNRSSEAYNVTKLSLEGRVKELEGDVEQQHQSYQAATGEQEEAFKGLAAADDEAAAAIALRTDRLRHLQETLAQWRGRIVANSSEWQRRNAALAREKEIVLGHHTALKAELAKFRGQQEASLKQMCVAYADVEAGLLKHLATAQRIVRIATLCRRHELPGEAAAGNDEEEAGSSQLLGLGGDSSSNQQETAAGDGEAELEACSHLPPGLEGGSSDGSSRPGTSDALAELGLQPGSASQRLVRAFVRRMNRAVLGSAALEQERQRLAAENGALRAVIKSLEEGGSVGPGAAEGPRNTLLIINERLQRELGGSVAQRGTCASL